MFGKDIRLPSLFRGEETRAILQFQTRLLQEAALTADSEKRWRARIQRILSDASGLFGCRFLFVFPTIDNEKDCIELFWLTEPSAEDSAKAEQAVRREIARHDEFRLHAPRNARQTIETRTPSGAVLEDFLVRCKSFPAAAGENILVGVELAPSFRGNELRDAALDSALTAIANIVLSIGALSVYRLQAERFATRDPLTNLYNQIACWDLLEYETNRAKRQEYQFSLLVLDLDNFKTINDLYGHETGDDFLREFSELLRASVRSGDIAARYAGDQFAAILPVCDESQAFTVAKRILENLRSHALTLPNGTAVKATVSIGMAVFPDHASNAKDLFLLADNMHSQAKALGKDRVCVPSEQDEIALLKSLGEKNIMILSALAEKRIIPYFQPIMGVKDQRIEAYEVLTRIATPERIISAAEFIETAEGMGAIGRIDYQLFEHALAKMHDAAYDGKLFINLSPRVLVLSEFMPRIRKMMRDYCVEPTNLIFEITERDTVKNLALVHGFIRDLKLDGFRFAIDDFGSGYSSFQYIKAFSVDYLKVDGDFIRNMGNGNGSIERHIVSSIASLATRLGIKTVAEYVETEDILNQVAAAGIDFAQGYFIQHPSPDLF
jgi:diguanylate cyclase (GGDEF)-like protein